MPSHLDRLPMRAILVAAGILGAIVSQSAPAAAVSSTVRNACMSDYFAYCSQHDVDSAGLRRCMQAAGPKLSKACVTALVAAGEVKVATNERRSSKSRKKPA